MKMSMKTRREVIHPQVTRPSFSEGQTDGQQAIACCLTSRTTAHDCLRLEWNTSGALEIDLVEHNGESSLGSK